MEYRLEERLDCGLIVVFSPINIPKGKFGFSRFFEEEKRSVLFFNCENTWYVDCIKEMKEVIDSVLNRLKPSSVVFYGASMGGYAAMRIGGLYPKYPTFLFGPELELYIPGSLSHKNATIRQDNVDILAHTNLDLSNTVVLFGIYEPIDLKQYQISLELNFYATIAVKSPHAVHQELYYRNLVRPLANSTSCAEFIENLPEFNEYNSNQQKRFITLIDIIYEKKIPLMITSKTDLSSLKSSKSLQDIFKRSISRLYELTSIKYSYL